MVRREGDSTANASETAHRSLCTSAWLLCAVGCWWSHLCDGDEVRAVENTSHTIQSEELPAWSNITHGATSHMEQHHTCRKDVRMYVYPIHMLSQYSVMVHLWNNTLHTTVFICGYT